MPDLLNLENLNARASGARSFDGKDYIAIAIGPASLGDAVIVGTRVLRAGQVMTIPKGQAFDVAPWRSYRHGVGFAASDEVVNRIELVAWRCGETPIANPRSPVRCTMPPQSVNGVGAALARQLRVPYQGRRMAQLTIMGTTSGLPPTGNWSVYGLRYQPRDVALATATPATLPMRYTLLGTGVIPMDTAAPTGLPDQLATFAYVGGTDSAELFDELELWTTIGGTSGAVTLTGEIECWGEHGSAGGE